MKRKFYILILGLCLCLCGCLGPFKTEKWFYESLITVYENVDYGGVSEVLSFPSQRRVIVAMPTKIYAHYVWEGYEWLKQNNPDWEIWHERHRELSRKNGDVGFNREEDVTNGAFMHRVWNTDNLMTAMSIVSNADFDETHPAETPLDDIVEITYNSYKHIIENDYTLPEGCYWYGYCHSNETKLLSEFVKEDAIFMMVDNFVLYFVDQPTAAQHHTFTVTVEFEHSEPYSFSFDMDFTSAE